MTEPETGIYGGVDTHRDVHVVAVADQTGRIRDVASFPATMAGYRQLLAWMRRHGELIRVGIEGVNRVGVQLDITRLLGTDAGCRVGLQAVGIITTATR